MKQDLNYLINHILYQVFEIILIMSSKNRETFKIDINKIENRNTYKIKSGYYLQLLPHETMKLMISTEENVAKWNENILPLDITELILVHYNLVTNTYKKNSNESFIRLISKNLHYVDHLDNYWKFHH